MDRSKITGRSEGLDRFVDEWNDPATDSVEAHTSGSTGKPKNIRLLKSDMRASAAEMCRIFGLSSESILALPLSPDYIAGKMMVVRTEICGGRLIVEHPSNHPFADWKAQSPDDAIDLIALVPSQTEAFAATEMARHTRRAIIGGAPLSATQEKELIAAMPQTELYATYGMTETCSNVALRSLGTRLYKANGEIRFTADSRGCLVIEAPMLSQHRFITNDICRIGADGRTFEWLGRHDNVINSGGVKLHPEEIDTKLAALLPPGSFFITGRQSARWGTEPVAVVDLDTIRIDRDLRSAAEGLLSPYERPKAWYGVRGGLPRASNDKLRRILPPDAELIF